MSSSAEGFTGVSDGEIQVVVLAVNDAPKPSNSIVNVSNASYRKEAMQHRRKQARTVYTPTRTQMRINAALFVP